MRFLLSLLALAMLTSFAAAGDKPAVILKHEGWVAAVSFSPDSKTLASAGADNVVRLWEVGTWKAKGVLKGHTDCVSAIAFRDFDTIATGSFDQSAKLWSVKSQSVYKNSTIKHKGAVLSVAFGNNVWSSAGVDATFRLRDPVKQGGSDRTSHKSWINCVMFDPWNTRFATASSDSTVHLYDQHPLHFEKPTILDAGAGEVRAVAFSPDGKLLAAGNRYHTVRVWDVATKKEVVTLAGHMSDVWSIAFSPDGKTLAAADTDWKKPSKVKLWDTTTWKERGALDVPGEILSIAYSPDGNWLAVGSWDKTVRVFSLK